MISQLKKSLPVFHQFSSMNQVTSLALFFLAAGIFTSVSILSVYQILFVIPLGYYLFLAIKEKKLKLPVSAWLLLIFALIALLSLILNFQIIPNPSKNFGRLKYFLFGFAGIFALRAWLPEVSDKTKKILINTFLLSITATSLYAFYFSITHPELRVTGLTNTMRYGYGSAMALLIILSGILHQKKIQSWFNWKMASVVFLLGFTGMYLTLTRGALLGFLCGLPFVFYFYKPKFGIIFGIISLIVVGTLSGFYFFGNIKLGQNSRLLISKDNKSDVMRRSQWQAAIIAIKEKPILGWGLSNFHSQLKRIKNDYDLEAKDYDDAHSHNLFLEIGSGTGLVGLIIFCGWIFMWAFEIFMNKGLVRSLVIPFGVAFVVCSQFEVTFDANNASMIFFVYGLSSACTYKNSSIKCLY